MKKIVETSVNGKIYIAGEYAVVVGGSAIIFPVNRKVKVKLTLDDNYYLYSHKYHDNFIFLDLNDNNKNYKYIIETIKWFNDYLVELNKIILKYRIEITSELDDLENKKYGFGSSAAILICLLKALFEFYDLKYDELILYKAGVLIQSKISLNTSFGDLACIAYSNQVLYRKFNPDIYITFKNKSITEILNQNWDELIIKKLNYNLNFLIVHTSKEANSYALVEEVLMYKDTIEFKNFYETSEKLVSMLINNQKEHLRLISLITENLKYLERFTNTQLYTKEMNEISEIIKKYNGVMKFSGAGGGDSVICFFEERELRKKLKEELKQKGYSFIEY